MDIAFLITTYNRQESCQRLVDNLQGLGEIIVLGDGVDYTISGCSFHNQPHQGRRGYWITVKRLFSLRGKHEYYMMLPDDFLIRESQISHAIDLFEGIEDPLKICLNLFMDRYGLRCWTNFYPIDKGDIWQTGWVDMCFLAKDDFFRRLRLRKGFSENSSGVGSQISRQLFREGFHFYQVKESLVSIQYEHTISQMHKEDGKEKIRRHRISPRTRTGLNTRSQKHSRPGR